MYPGGTQRKVFCVRSSTRPLGTSEKSTRAESPTPSLVPDTRSLAHATPASHHQPPPLRFFQNTSPPCLLRWLPGTNPRTLPALLTQ